VDILEPLELQVYVSAACVLKYCCFSTPRTTRGCFNTSRNNTDVSVPVEPQVDVSVHLEEQMDVSPHNAMYH
jgi:hypothetical protein